MDPKHSVIEGVHCIGFQYGKDKFDIFHLIICLITFVRPWKGVPVTINYLKFS